METNKIRLGEIATYVNGYAFKPKDRGNVGLPIVRIQDLTGNARDVGFYLSLIHISEPTRPY